MAKKPDWLYRQSAAIPYIEKEGAVEIVLVSSSSKTGWVLPKGVIERFLSPEESAAKEALEEAGVRGEVSSTLIEEYTYEKWGGVCTVKVYPLQVTEILQEWDEVKKRERIVVSIDEAISLVKPEQRSSLRKFQEFIKQRVAISSHS